MGHTYALKDCAEGENNRCIIEVLLDRNRTNSVQIHQCTYSNLGPLKLQFDLTSKYLSVFSCSVFGVEPSPEVNYLAALLTVSPNILWDWCSPKPLRESRKASSEDHSQPMGQMELRGAICPTPCCVQHWSLFSLSSEATRGRLHPGTQGYARTHFEATWILTS